LSTIALLTILCIFAFVLFLQLSSSAQQNPWARICELVELKADSAITEKHAAGQVDKMRSLLIQMKTERAKSDDARANSKQKDGEQ
jgi:hypothetical protein